MSWTLFVMPLGDVTRDEDGVEWVRERTGYAGELPPRPTRPVGAGAVLAALATIGWDGRPNFTIRAGHDDLAADSAAPLAAPISAS